MPFVYCKILNFIILQSLYKAKENEIETEHHFKALAEREYGRLKNDIKRLKDEIASLKQKKNIQEVRFEIFGWEHLRILQNFMGCPYLHILQQ